MKRLFALLAVATYASLAAAPSRAVELLTGGDIEPSLPGWTITESQTGGTDPADTISQEGFANQPDSVTNEAGVFLKPWAGGSAVKEFNNATITQTVPGTAGENYTFSGWSKFEGNYSGGVDTLFFTSPHDPDMTGTVPSPTQTKFEMAFLNGSGGVIGSPVSLDLRTVQMDDQTWRQHTLMGLAPAGTANIRVSASMLNGVFNRDPTQSAFFDNFSLTGASAPTTDKLVNGNWNQTPTLTPEWKLTELPDGTDTASFAGFANHTPGGSNGLWLRAFEGDATNMGVDAILSQTVAAVPNGQYTFSGWSKWEGNYSGGVTTLSGSSPLGAVASPTKTSLELAFLDASDAVIGTPVTLDLRTVQMNDSTWRQSTLMGTAPANAAKVRVTASAVDMVFNTDPQQSAFFDDFSLMGPGASTPIPGDRDGDNDVDGNDFLLIQRGLGTTTSATDIATWKANYGRTSGTAVFVAVPEPATFAVAMLACVALAAANRRQAKPE